MFVTRRASLFLPLAAVACTAPGEGLPPLPETARGEYRLGPQDQVRVTVEPGPRTAVRAVEIGFAGAIADDAAAQKQRDAIRSGWALGPGKAFSQQEWDNAKTLGLRTLTAQRFPTGSVQMSRADIDADAGTARLAVTYQSGPAYRFGPLQLRGAERYGADAARRIARVPIGEDYDQQKLLDAQQRLASSGYYDSVFLTLDTEQPPPFAPVVAQLREAPLQKVVLGVGFTSDSGPRVSVDHIHNKIPGLEWRAAQTVERLRTLAAYGRLAPAPGME